MRFRHVVLAALATVLAAGAGTTAAAAVTTAPPSPPPTDQPLSVNSTAPRLGQAGGSETFTIDVETGKVLSASKGPIFTPAITGPTNGCASGHACYTAPAPNVQYGFYGTPGTKSGSWSNRNGYNSGVSRVSTCWVTSDLTSRCSSFVLNPGNRVQFNSLVRGTSLTIHG